MNCREFEEHISAAVDSYLKPSDLALFEDHASKCPSCRRAYQDERQTKLLVQNRLHLQRTPEAVVAAILDRLDRDAHAPVIAFRSRLFTTPAWRPVLAVAAVVVAALILARPGSTVWQPGVQDGGVPDVIHQTHEMYDAMIGGGWQPEMVSSQPDFVRSYFVGKTDFPVHVPAMRQCTLLGGGLEEVGGMKFAHVIYQGTSGMIYLCQVCSETAMRGERLQLPSNARTDLERTGWHTQTLPDGDVLVLWMRGATLCAAISRMPSDDLIAALTSEEDSLRK